MISKNCETCELFNKRLGWSYIEDEPLLVNVGIEVISRR